MIALVADAGPTIGLGHAGRCSAIAAALRARGLEVACIAYGAPQPVTVDAIAWTPGDDVPAAARAIVLDTYTMPPADRAALAARAPLTVMHDLDPVPPGTRLVVTVERTQPAGGALVLAGLRYAPLRPPFWGLPARAPRSEVRRILVTTGGGAVAGGGVAIAAALEHEHPDATVALVRGPFARFDAPAGVELVDAPASLLSEMLAADVVVTAAGQTALESVATGAATVAVPLADNQRRNARVLAAAGAAVAAEPGEAVAAVAQLDRLGLAERGQRAVDGFGALRIAWHVARLAAE